MSSCTSAGMNELKLTRTSMYGHPPKVIMSGKLRRLR